MQTVLLAAALLAGAWQAASAADLVNVWRKAGWKTDFSRTAVNLFEIQSGGPPRDGIPAIDAPAFRSVAEIRDVGPNEPVIRLALNGITRAYPLRVLTWHEIVNDTIAGQPVAVTYCPLCNSAVVFDRRVDGRELSFGVSGLLRHSDMVMYDRQTETWWQQFSGTAIVGALTGTKLRMIPSRVESFATFAAANPTGEVLVPNDPTARAYGRNPYVAYDSRGAPYPFHTGALPKEIDPMARVVVVRDGDAVHAVTLEHLRAKRTIDIGGITLAWRSGVASALDTAAITRGRDVGAVRAVRAGEEVVHDITFAFVVLAFHPDVVVMTERGPVDLGAGR